MDADEISPWASWDDDRIVAWARAHKLDRYPIANVQLATISQNEPNVAVIDFQRKTVTRKKPLPL